MKVSRLLLCILLSLAFAVTFIPALSFADDDDDYENTFTAFDEISGSAVVISVGQTKTVTNEGIFEFTPTVSGYYVFYSSITSDPNADPVGRAMEDDGTVIADNDDYTDTNPNFKVCFYGYADETYYLQAITYTGTATFGVSLAKDVLVKDVIYTPVGNHYATIRCDEVIDNDSYWNSAGFAIGDKITVKYENNTSKEYVYKMKPDAWMPNKSVGAFVNTVNEKEEVPGDVELTYYQEFPASVYKLGQTTSALADFCFADAYNARGGYYDEEEWIEVDDRIHHDVSINVKFILAHEKYNYETYNYDSTLTKTAAVAATCTAAGNSEYWQCTQCKRYYKDQAAADEFASGAWVIPATGHKFTKSKVTKKAGLLKNGTKVQVCSVCGAYGKTSVVPGWSTYYVKAPKATAGKKSFTVKWKKQSKANLKKFNGYQVRYSLKKNMAKAKMVKVKKTATSKTIKKLKSKKKYYVQVRTFTKKAGKTYYSKWSPKKTVKTR